MSYDADGNRYKKEYYKNGTTITHEYITDGKKILREIITGGANAGTIYYMYNGEELVGFTYKNKEYYFQRDLRGDIIEIWDNSTSRVARYVYDAWGNHKVYDSNGYENTTDTFIGNINPFRYRGYYYDVETNLFLVTSRYYSPELGRFIQPADVSSLDPKSVNGLNLYCYCSNNPVMCRLGYNLGGVISDPIGNIGSISSNISSRNKSSSPRSMFRASASSTPFANVVSMTNYSTTLVDNILFGMVLGNISHTTTIQHNNSGVYYAYLNIGNSTSSVGLGLNIKDWYGLNAYVSSNIGIGSSIQLGSITYGAEISF